MPGLRRCNSNTAEVLLQGTRGAWLQIRTGCGIARQPADTDFPACQLKRVAGGAELPVFLTPDFIRRLVEVFEVFKDMEPAAGGQPATGCPEDRAQGKPFVEAGGGLLSV